MQYLEENVHNSCFLTSHPGMSISFHLCLLACHKPSRIFNGDLVRVENLSKSGNIRFFIRRLFSVTIECYTINIKIKQKEKLFQSDRSCSCVYTRN